MHRAPKDAGATPRLRLMVVDDEQKLRHLMTEFFSLKRFDVRAVCRGEEALALTQVFHPDVVVLDLLLPGRLTGVETLKALKALRPAPKVVMFSAADHEEVVRGALALGADHYLRKPASLHELERLVNGGTA